MGIRCKIITAKLIFVLFFLFAFLSINDCEAATLPTGLNNAFNTNQDSPLNAVANQGAGFNETATFESIVGKVITMTLGFMGVIFLVLAIYGGYNWMMARGNEDVVEKAKKTITNAIIGLIIVLSAYAVSVVIVNIIGGAVLK